MRFVRLIPYFALLCLCLSARATTITLSGNSDPTCGASQVCISSSSFDVTVNSSGGGAFQVINETTSTLTGLEFDIPYYDPNCPGGTPVTPTLIIEPSFSRPYGSGGVNSNVSTSCDVTAGEADYMLTLTFLPGVPSDYEFTLSLNDPGFGTGGWVPGPTSDTASFSTPEPGTLLAASAGLALLLAARLRKWAFTPLPF
jgi:hypothetical protein